jgi:hypothetical protein
VVDAFLKARLKKTAKNVSFDFADIATVKLLNVLNKRN